ncbi:hypothetical protein THSYN_32190 (plasmid) [Candidatus Thiodictyon syntrophicum]|jgi:hypothetical protein|uniref:Uncharacterized protein n=1 Tax=Candidatus Thiodictyon syntrophicum TaxID=1166950 RepID=A0A2K8UJ78_9GAMM|nr:hypothetical protein THSYN_32190 [Candidatus Thiodictyon syntrophicum]
MVVEFERLDQDLPKPGIQGSAPAAVGGRAAGDHNAHLVAPAHKIIHRFACCAAASLACNCAICRCRASTSIGSVGSVAIRNGSIAFIQLGKQRFPDYLPKRRYPSDDASLRGRVAAEAAPTGAIRPALEVELCR